MSQEQPTRPQHGTGHQQQPGIAGQEIDPIKYGDVFGVSGELASKPIAPEDANMMQSAETMVFGKTQKGGPAAAMQSAATFNERAGLVGHHQATDAATNEGVTVTETDIPGARIITESVGGQVLGQYVQPTPIVGVADVKVIPQDKITIGEALEATGRSSGDKPVDQSDASAIQAAEARATGSSVTVPGGLASVAQSAATYNAAVDRDEEKIKLGDVLRDAAGKLGADKVVTREDAEGVVSAEMRNNPDMSTDPAGVAASMTAAARLNQSVIGVP
ncbi:Late embryogenesis abundant protein 31 [Linum grandiflorum]